MINIPQLSLPEQQYQKALKSLKELIVFENEKIDAETQDKILQNQVKQINNRTIKYCEEKGIQPDWKNPLFKEFFIFFWKKLLTVLDKNNQNTFSPYFYYNIVNNEKDQFILFYEDEQIVPKNWKQIKETTQMKHEKIIQEIEFKPLANTDEICKKCKKQEVISQERQTRSIDEPSTTFYTCTNCSHNWKI